MYLKYESKRSGLVPLTDIYDTIRLLIQASVCKQHVTVVAAIDEASLNYFIYSPVVPNLRPGAPPVGHQTDLRGGEMINGRGK